MTIAEIPAAKPSKYLVSQSRFLQKGQKALLVADGEGRNSIWCAEMGLAVDAFDVLPDAIEKARQLALARGVSVTYAVSCCDEWDWQPEKYDIAIIICANFAKPAMRTRLFNNCIATLKPGGILILKGHSIRHLDVLLLENWTPELLATKVDGVAHEEHYYSEALLRDAFSSLDILEVVNYEEPARKKDGSIRMEALVGMVAQKKRA